MSRELLQQALVHLENACMPAPSFLAEIRAHLAAQAQAKPLEFLMDGARFKLNFNAIGNCTTFQNLAHELQGRWVALVGAENDKHMAAQPLHEQLREMGEAHAAQPAPAVIDTSLRGFIDAVAADRREAAQPAPVPADLTMTRDELVAAAESIGMRFPAPVPVPLTGHVYLVQWKQDGTQCIEAFADRSAAVAYANNIGSHAYVACVAVRTPEYVTHVFGIAASPEKP